MRLSPTIILLACVCGVSAQPPQGGPLTSPDGQINFERLRQLIDESRAPKVLTPEQQKLAEIVELKIDRSPAGILAVKMLEARPPATAPAPPQGDPAKSSLESFRRDLVLGRWEKVSAFFDALPKEIQAEAFQSVVGKLAAPAQIQPPREIIAQGAKPYAATAFLPPEDWLGLASSSPQSPSPDVMKLLVNLLPGDPYPPASFFAALDAGVRHFGGTDPANRSRAAEVLLDAGWTKEAEKFLPDLDEARGKSDYKALNLIARHRATLAQGDASPTGKESLRLAWEISTSFLNDTKAPPPARSEALFRALSLIPQLGDTKGKEWLERTFSDPKGEGVELLGTLGTLTTLNRENPDASVRLEQLRTQHAAVRSVLSIPSADREAWAEIFTLFARQWNHEAGVTREKDQTNSRRNIPQFDPFGNVFYVQNQPVMQGEGTRPVSTADLLDCRPDEEWLEVIEATTRQQCMESSARLFLKVKEEDAAIPLIKRIASSHRENAVSLVKETIKVWAENHNPNEQQKYRQQYMYFYGYNNQAGAIPLTRSKQERNLVELAELVKGIRALDLGESFQEELTEAFISCHSQAEVWRVESIERVFGTPDALDATTLAAMTSRMRLNLAGLWPNPKLQEAYKTNRRDTELQEQILQGYAAATGMIERALDRQPEESWKLRLQLAALRFEESNYRSTIAPDNRHAGIKRAALDAMAEAAEQYVAGLPLEDQEKETTDSFEVWTYAALGSPSLEALKSHHVATPGEFDRIKALLAKLPDEVSERHLKSLATTLNTRLANVSPDLKLRYLEGVCKIVGDRREMADAVAVRDFYGDLVSEIELSVTLDGTDRIDPASPFGLKVNLRHTKEIERESGGFQRYLQNQTSAQFAWNFGRPPEDYRDKFEKAARTALEEHFEVISVAFHSEKVESRTDPQLGWRLTPYAYLLLKPKGPQVDRIPSLKIDLDFTDTSGYVIIPITSAEIPVDASGKGDPRPFGNLRITQTLDERSHDQKGSLLLEVKATSHGLVPSLENLMPVTVEGFEVANTEDQGLRISELDAQTDDLAPISEREWRMELKPAGGKLPASFRFPAPKAETAADDGWVRQRYQDVDLVAVPEQLPLERKASSYLSWLFALLVVPVGWLGWKLRKRPVEKVHKVMIPLPSHCTPVTVLAYLRRLREEADSIPDERRKALDHEIESLERNCFGRSDGAVSPEELQRMAGNWQTEAACLLFPNV